MIEIDFQKGYKLNISHLIAFISEVKTDGRRAVDSATGLIFLKLLVKMHVLISSINNWSHLTRFGGKLHVDSSEEGVITSHAMVMIGEEVSMISSFTCLSKLVTICKKNHERHDPQTTV